MTSYGLALRISGPLGRHCTSRLSCVQIIPIYGQRCERISQNSYFHRQLSHQTALPMQQFSSLNQWQGGSQAAGWYKPFQHAPTRLHVAVDVKWDRRAMNLQQYILLVICTQQHVITHSSVAAGQIPWISTHVFFQTGITNSSRALQRH